MKMDKFWLTPYWDLGKTFNRKLLREEILRLVLLLVSSYCMKKGLLFLKKEIWAKQGKYEETHLKQFLPEIFWCFILVINCKC